jgi:acyl-CoA thioesterase-1
MKKFLLTFLLWLFTLPALAENTILIIGDSLSAGYGIDPKQGWVALLQKRLIDNNLDYKVINSSISGDTTSNGLSRLPTALTLYKPDITIIELGANDGLRGLQIALIKKNLEQLIQLVIQANSKVLVLGLRLPPNYGASYTEQFQQIYLELAKRDDISVVPLFLKDVDDKRSLKQADGIHPTAQAQVIILDNIWTALLKLL